MDRRDLLRLILAATGAPLVGCGRARPGTAAQEAVVLTDDDVALLDAVADTLLPATDTPGARQAGVGAFMRLVVQDCYAPPEQATFVKGLRHLRALPHDGEIRRFDAFSAPQRLRILETLEPLARAHNARLEAQEAPASEAGDAAASEAAPDQTLHFYTLLKQLAVWGYFTSEAGLTTNLRYDPLPGHYDGHLPYRPGDKAQAESFKGMLALAAL